jgi:hypothetical protein
MLLREVRMQLLEQVEKTITESIEAGSYYSQQLPASVALTLFKKLSKNTAVKPVLSRDPESLQPILTVTRSTP